MTRREDILLEETLYEEQQLPVCSPALLYDLGWDADWAYWFARQGQSTPDRKTCAWITRAVGSLCARLSGPRASA